MNSDKCLAKLLDEVKRYGDLRAEKIAREIFSKLFPMINMGVWKLKYSELKKKYCEEKPCQNERKTLPKRKVYI